VKGMSDLDHITSLTLQHYQQNAAGFREGTKDHDVSQNINTLLRHIRDFHPIDGSAPYTILDFGCGPGRDLKTFQQLGHTAIGLEGAENFVHMARTDSGCEVWLQNFLELYLPRDYFHGVFANASLFHVPREALVRVLKQLHLSLKTDGVLFSSNPRGANEEGWHGGRYGCYHSMEAWCAYMNEAGFVELEHYYRPDGLPREQQPWLASVWRKVDE
jgi:SAM-dependent methyltransferase